ncbi:MAG: ribonuclease HII [Candidatus Pacearchaeota archaeon]|nr:ribonuclease HII [Nanoarchaeota archaeon]MDZ4226759.1 ribonuclease HII [Candidatus Pacearchaeota archaeon]
MSNLILGIDDAGRGPVIGPLILAGCLITEETGAEFRRLGVKDSKQLTKKRRAFLESTIKEKAAAFVVRVTHASEIDGKNHDGTNLNDLEAQMAAMIINEINKASNANNGKIKVVIDCPSTNRTKWRETVLTKVENLFNLEILCEHKADINHIAVSAASILAKQEREREMDILREKYGESIGSGYSSDPITRKFLEKNIKKLEDKGIFRKTWKTWKRANHDSDQKKLF